MATVLGALRRLVMAPSLADVTFEKRGFPVAGTEAAHWLEAIPQAVVCGFEWGIDGTGQWELERRLSLTTPELRGFAYEGATMAFTILDVMPGRGRHRTRDLLLGPGRPHIFLAYIGIGFAMARLPRATWKRVLPDLSGSAYYPTMSWLAVDGYAFDRAYFDTKRYVDRQELPAAYPWLGAPEYFPRAADQGIGRALWFMCGAQVPDVSAAVRRFAVSRHADLWSGVGLAATFAGGGGAEDLSALRRAAGEYQAELAQGAVFAIKARDYSGCVPPHTNVAASALAGMSVADAVALADDAEVTDDAKVADAEKVPCAVVAGGAAGRVPPYEQWRRNVQTHFAATADRFIA
jgi:enediyne biosynthesis protein E2